MKLSTKLLLSVLLLTGVSASAQSAVDTGTDVQLHKFRPNVSPELAAHQANADQTIDANGISRFAAAQMRALEQEKETRTAAQQKIDSNLLYTERMLQGRDAAPGVAYLETGVDLDPNNNIVVDMVANVTDSLLTKLTAAGVTIVSSYASLRSVRAVIPPAAIETIAAFPEVIFISPRQAFGDNVLHVAPKAAPGRALEKSMIVSPELLSKAAHVRAMLAQVQHLHPETGGTPNYGQGSVETEGDLTHQAVDARGIYGINGAGLKIGVLSSGVTTAAASQATGDLPPTCATGVASPCLTVLSGQTGSGDEGTAMLEIIHDMVPGANLYFATADNGIASFATNIRSLQAAGCNIIVDDVFYYAETPFQNGQASTVTSNTNAGVVIQAVSDVVAAGVFYFTSAGNGGSLDDGTSATFEGDFNGMASAAPLPTTGAVHNFGSSVGYDSVTAVGNQIVTLQWADPLGGSANDYDLYLLNSAGTAVLASSTNLQTGTQDPYEAISTSNITIGTRLVVYQKPGAAGRFFHLDLARGGLAVATSGETHGHSAAAAAYSVAATPAAAPYSSGATNGPYPGPFVSSDKTETFSSDGLRRIFFNADSTPITVGNFSSTGGSVLNKPDITAADGVSVTGVGGFGSPFYGTSAAAPSAASVAALVLSAKPTITAAQMMTALTSTAVDIMGSGYDRDAGAGIVMALPAVKSTGAVGGANLELGSITATENPGNGNGVLEAGEGALLTVQLMNATGVTAATGISATLTTSTAGVILEQPASSTYADLAVGAGPENSVTSFGFALAANLPCGQLVQFALNVTYSNGQTRVLPFSVQTGLMTINNTLGSTPALPTGITFATGTQVSRISRSGVVSTCAAVKAYPGAVTGANHAYDSYSFQSCTNTCITPQLNAGAAGINLFESIYTPTFSPSNIATNYAGDAGLSGSTQSFGVNVAASTSYSLVIADVNGNPPSTGIVNAYSVQIPICAINCNPYPLPLASVRNVTVTAATSGGTANANINNGSSDPNGGPITLSQSPAGPYPVGVTSVILTVTNKYGGFAQATATVTVNNPAPGLTVNANSVNYGTPNTTLSATVTYTGTAPTGAFTFQVDSGTILTAICSAASGSENCSVSYPTGTLTVGSHTITGTIAADQIYGSATSTATLTVSDYFAALSITGVPVIVSPGTPQTATVRALGASGATYSTFTGTVTLSSTDPLATFSPTSYTFTAADAGVKTFTVTFNTGGTYSLTATSGTVSGSVPNVRVGDYIWALSNTGAATRTSESGTALTSSAGGQVVATFGGIAFDATGQSYSVVNTSNAVTRTAKTDTGAITLTGGGLSAPDAIAVDGAGLIWVANSGNNSLSVFASGAAVSPSTGLAPASVTAPSAVAIDATGGVWVTNRTAGTVTHLFGAATPVLTPLANAAGNGQLGVKP